MIVSLLVLKLWLRFDITASSIVTFHIFSFMTLRSCSTIWTPREAKSLFGH